MKSDFSGYASKADLLCMDGRTIRPNAFVEDHGKEVPIYLEHRRTGVKTELGRAVLENRKDGTYVYGTFNDTPEGKSAREAVRGGIINGLSVRATDLVHRGADVVKGIIEEVSLVLKGANPGASIQHVTMEHSSGYPIEIEDEAVIYTGLTFEHSASEGEDMDNDKETEEGGGDETIRDILATLDEKQMQAVSFLIESLTTGKAEGESEKPSEEEDSEEVKHSAKKEEDDDDEVEEEIDLVDEDSEEDPEEKKKSMNHSAEEANMGNKRNVFDGSKQVEESNTLTHSQMETIIETAKRTGSLREAVMEHAATYGFEDIDILFPEAQALSNKPELLARRVEWVQKVLNPARKSPFARVKSIVADITAEEARARGYVKGNMKKEEVIKLLKRKTDPTTIYKKQKLDRDDMIDIRDLDVVAFLKEEMRLMLDEEIARAILLGDGREADDDDKIDEESIRPIVKEEAMYAEHVELPSNSSALDKMEAMIRARASYRGTGTPTFYTTLSFITDLLLLKDKMGRRLFRNMDELASELLASEIVPVEVMEEYPNVAGVYVNMTDYTIGANKGGEVSFFDDFDIDYNQHKYLYETRISGALNKPKSAIVIHTKEGTPVTPVSPSFNGETNTITIPTIEGIVYKVDGVEATGDNVITKDAEVTAHAEDGYYIPGNTVTNWTFVYSG